LSFHALAIGVIFGLVFMLGALIGGPFLYMTMGGSGPSLAVALTRLRGFALDNADFEIFFSAKSLICQGWRLQF
jgi:hypothetical protein